MLFRVRSCEQVKRPERLDEESLFFVCWASALHRGTTWRSCFAGNSDFGFFNFLYLCRVEDSERKVGVMVEGQ